MAQSVERSEVTVLLADDTFEILNVVRARLAKRGYKLLEANDGEEALQLALQEQPNAIVLDVMMPRLNGWEVCKYLRDRETFNDVGILMLTAIGPKLNELTSPLYGADEYLDKPFELDDLEQALERVLEKRAGLVVS